MNRDNRKITYIISGIIIICVIGVLLILNSQPAKDTIPALELSLYLNLDESLMNEAQMDSFLNAKELLENNVNDKDGLVNLANLQRLQGNYEISEIILEYTLQLYEGDTIALQNLASLYHETKRYSEAEELYYQILENNPLWMSAFEELAQLYRFELVPRVDRFPNTINKSRELDFTKQYESTLLRYLGFYYKYAGDNSQSIDYFRQYLELKPDDQAIQGVFKELGGSAVIFE